MYKEKGKPAHESLVDGIEIIIDNLEVETPFTVDKGSMATAIEAMMASFTETKIPEKHQKEVADRLRALADSSKDKTPFIYFSLLGLAWAVEQPDEEEPT